MEIHYTSSVLLGGIRRLARKRNVLDVVTRDRHQSAHARGPQRGDDAGRPAAPIIAGQQRPIDAERIQKIAQVRAQRRLLAGAHGCGERKRVAPKPRNQGTNTR